MIKEIKVVAWVRLPSLGPLVEPRPPALTLGMTTPLEHETAHYWKLG